MKLADMPTIEQVMNEPAGERLDRWTKETWCYDRELEGECSPSTDIRLAFHVLEVLADEAGCSFCLSDDGYECCFAPDIRHIVAIDKSACVAICRATVIEYLHGFEEHKRCANANCDQAASDYACGGLCDDCENALEEAA